MSTYLRKKKQIRDKLLGSLTYPAVVLLVAAGGFVLIATIVLPQMRSIFAELGASVPPAAVTLTRSTSVLGKAIGALFGLVGATPAILLARRTRWASAIDRMLLRLPILGSMLIRREMLNYVFAMETLSESGIPVETALREGAAVFQNHALAAGARRIADRVSDGVALSAALDEAEPFPPRLAIWARIGERTGNAGSIFGQLRGYYEEEMNRWIDRFMTLVEPALIVAVGIVMLVFVVTFVAPLFQVFGSVL
jgi:type II secretory pathway component PulF